MVHLTSFAWKRKGSTKLYIPLADSDNLANFATDNELQHRIDALLQFWSNQIKDVTNAQEVNKDQEEAGPLDVIQYWRERRKNLSYINK